MSNILKVAIEYIINSFYVDVNYHHDHVDKWFNHMTLEELFEWHAKYNLKVIP